MNKEDKQIKSYELNYDFTKSWALVIMGITILLIISEKVEVASYFYVLFSVLVVMTFYNYCRLHNKLK